MYPNNTFHLIAESSAVGRRCLGLRDNQVMVVQSCELPFGSLRRLFLVRWRFVAGGSCADVLGPDRIRTRLCDVM
jgi:hypothetical protein